jgi:hypothetical protein
MHKDAAWKTKEEAKGMKRCDWDWDWESVMGCSDGSTQQKNGVISVRSVARSPISPIFLGPENDGRVGSDLL